MDQLPGTWYAKEGGRLAEFYTILHLPYTGMVLCFVALAAFLAPDPNWGFLFWSLLAYFLGLGIGSHALDQLSGRPWGKAFTDTELKILASLSLLGAVALGAYFALVVSAWFWIFISLGLFFAVAYNVEKLFGGFFHTDGWFILSWAALPFLTSFFVQSRTITIEAIVVSTVLMGLAAMEITLSRWVKEQRRTLQSVELVRKDGSRHAEEILAFIRKPQRALKLVVLTTYLLTAAVAGIRFL